MKVWTLMIQTNLMIPQVLDDPKRISIGSMDFENPNVNGDTPIFDGLIFSFVSFGKFII